MILDAKQERDLPPVADAHRVASDSPPPYDEQERHGSAGPSQPSPAAERPPAPQLGSSQPYPQHSQPGHPPHPQHTSSFSSTSPHSDQAHTYPLSPNGPHPTHQASTSSFGHLGRQQTGWSASSSSSRPLAPSPPVPPNQAHPSIPYGTQPYSPIHHNSLGQGSGSGLQPSPPALSPYHGQAPIQPYPPSFHPELQHQMLTPCQRGEHNLETVYGMGGIICSIMCFPIGILALLMDQEKKCRICGYSFEHNQLSRMP